MIVPINVKIKLNNEKISITSKIITKIVNLTDKFSLVTNSFSNFKIFKYLEENKKNFNLICYNINSLQSYQLKKITNLRNLDSVYLYSNFNKMKIDLKFFKKFSLYGINFKIIFEFNSNNIKHLPNIIEIINKYCISEILVEINPKNFISEKQNSFFLFDEINYYRNLGYNIKLIGCCLPCVAGESFLNKSYCSNINCYIDENGNIFKCNFSKNKISNIFSSSDFSFIENMNNDKCFNCYYFYSFKCKGICENLNFLDVLPLKNKYFNTDFYLNKNLYPIVKCKYFEFINTFVIYNEFEKYILLSEEDKNLFKKINPNKNLFEHLQDFGNKILELLIKLYINNFITFERENA